MTFIILFRLYKTLPFILCNLMLGASPVRAAIQPFNKPVVTLKTYLLSRVMQEGLSGIQFQGKKEQLKIRAEALLYAAARHPPLNSKVRESFISKCRMTANLSPYCQVFKKFAEKSEPVKNDSIKLALKESPSYLEVPGWFRKGQILKLISLPEKALRTSLKEILSYEEIKATVEQVVSSKSCQMASLSLMLGAKVEEFFPAPFARKYAIRLYEKAASCIKGDDSLRARFRVSLLYIWQNQCASARPHLEHLATHSIMNDYRSRALFWQIQCDNQLGNVTAALHAKQVLSENHPFSFHTLLVQSDKGDLRKLSLKLDARIQLRSLLSLRLNEKLQAVEALLALQEPVLAKEFLETIESELNLADPDLRVYGVVLWQRADPSSKKFRLLTSAFRDRPSLITRTTLELYYPNDTLQPSALSMSDVDQKLILSLIRQESAFNTRARSRAGALGLMQIMPSTARRYENIRRFDQLYDPTFNLKIGSKYFSGLMKTFDGDAELALAAYNAGPTRVDQWLKRYPVSNRILFLDLIPFKETREYVASIARNYYWYNLLYPNFPLKGKRSKRAVDSKAYRSLGSVFSAIRPDSPQKLVMVIN